MNASKHTPGAFLRFRIFNVDKQKLVGKFDTTERAYEFAKGLDRGLNYYFIDCTVDDIEVPLDDFMEAWEAGEMPGDLQHF